MRWICGIFFFLSSVPVAGAQPTFTVSIDDRPLENATVRVGQTVKIVVRTNDATPREFKLTKHQLMHEQVRDWDRQNVLEYRVTKEDLKYRYLDLAVETKESLGYKYEPAEPREIYRAQVHLALPDGAPPADAMKLPLPSQDDADTRAFVERAFAVLKARALDPRLLDCAWSRAFRDVPYSRDAFSRELGAALRGELALEMSDIRTEVAHAREWLWYESGFLYVSLSRHHLDRRSVNETAGVLAHEILHNLGYDHGGGLQSVDQGYFILAYESCF